MVWLGVLGAFGVLCYLGYKKIIDTERCFGAYIIFILFLFLNGLIGSIQFVIEADGIRSVEIVALRNTSNTDTRGGGNFLGWKLDSNYNESYVIMEKFEDGSYKKKYLSCDKTYVIETDKVSPKVEYIKYKNVIHKLWTPPWVRLYINHLDGWYSFKGATIYVPENTIIHKIEQI